MSAVSHAQDCPAERPIKRTVASPMMTCTLLACQSKLVCPSAPMLPQGAVPSLLGADCYYMPSNDCNQCTSTTSEICLSQEDFDKASAVR